MELALVVFNVGVGLGVLALGASVVYLAWHVTPLIRESRGLARDVRRLARMTDHELRPILTGARELSSSAQVVTEDLAVKLDRLGEVMNAVQAGVERGAVARAPGRPDPRPVESWETREDASDA